MKTEKNLPIVYLNKISENWIVDRFRNEWYQQNKSNSTKIVYKSNVIWLIAPWNWKNVSKKQLKKRKVLCTIHHIDENKFDEKESNEFIERDKYINEYHVVSKNTYKQVSKLTKKKITTLPFWINTDIWFEINDKNNLRKKYNLKENSFIVGSFQRDSEGKEPNEPKLSKGPDRFLEIVKYLKNENPSIHILLSGKRRNYLINELIKNNISYTYLEMVDFLTINELYNCLDLYIVASRFEGGPQSILECGITKTPIISTDVGIASEVLSKESLFDMTNFEKATPNTDYAFKNSLQYDSSKVFEKYNQMIKAIHES